MTCMTEKVKAISCFQKAHDLQPHISLEQGHVRVTPHTRSMSRERRDDRAELAVKDYEDPGDIVEGKTGAHGFPAHSSTLLAFLHADDAQVPEFTAVDASRNKDRCSDFQSIFGLHLQTEGGV